MKKLKDANDKKTCMNFDNNIIKVTQINEDALKMPMIRKLARISLS